MHHAQPAVSTTGHAVARLPWRALALFSTLLAVAAPLAHFGHAAEAPAKAPVPQVPPAAEILRTLRTEHPRLLTSKPALERLRRDVVGDPRLSPWWTKIRSEADAMLAAPPAKYEIPDGMRLLSVSRRVLARSYHLALAWQLTGDRKYSDRLAAEFTAVAGFPDWNPKHFLDTSEMAHALGIGYDWCYDAWTPEQRSMIRTALVTKALGPARIAYRESATNGGWPTVTHNWNQVCNGGITVGALAIADEEPELASELVAAASTSIQRAMAAFAPDGGWAEGPAYWGYATIYNVVFLAALDSALGTDFRISDLPGFSETGFYPIHITSPIGRSFNYADGRDGLLRSAPMFWLARRFNRPQFARYECEVATPHPLDLIWYDAKLSQQPVAPEPLDRHFKGIGVVTLRSAAPDPAAGYSRTNRALFVGFKAGDNNANHSHLDLGSFVLDALGVRWASDLGAEDYGVAGYFGAQRWDYYMTRAESHNTLVLNPDSGPDQDPKAVAPISRFLSRPEEAFAIADLSTAYARHARKVQRGISLHDQRRRILVQDEIEADKPADIYWFLQTTAKVESNGRVATLTYGRERLVASILSPADAVFTVASPLPLPSSPHPKDQTAIGGRKLSIQLKQAREARIAVLLVPLETGVTPPDPAGIPIRPLAEWN